MRLALMVIIIFSLTSAHAQNKRKANDPQGTSEGQPANRSQPSAAININIASPVNSQPGNTQQEDSNHKSLFGITYGEWLIAAITFCYVLISYRTWLTIDKQTKSTTDAAKATQESVRLQEAGLRQWLNIENWQVWLEKREGRLRLRFDLSNASTLPLTIHTISEHVVILGENTEHSEQSNFEAHVIAPNNPYIGDITMLLTNKQMDFLIEFADESAINLFVSCDVVFADIRGKRWKQIFDRAIFFGKGDLFGLKEYDRLTPNSRDFKNILREEPN